MLETFASNALTRPARRVLCLEISANHLVEAVHRFAAESDVKVVYWTGAKSVEATVRQAFPEAVFHESMRAIRGLPPDGGPIPAPIPADNAMLNALASCQAITLEMMDRMDADGTTFSHRERVRHYHNLLAIWHGILHSHAIDAVICPISPHLVFDYVAYRVARQLGIRTLMFERTAFPGRMLVHESIEQGSAALARAMQSEAKPVRLPQDISAEVDRLRSSGRAALAANYRRKVESRGLARDRSRRVARLSQALGKEIVGVWPRLLRSGAPHNYLKQPGATVAASSISRTGWAKQRLLGIWRQEKLLRTYERLAVQPALDEPFVFFGMHYQPERMTSPLADMVNDQCLVIEQLAAALPQGWRIYVKEHPWQLQPGSRGYMCRMPADYERLVACRSVDLVPLGMPAVDLIDNAMAVATLTGSVGFQAILRGKPVLAFGQAWYRTADGVFPISSLASCRQAMSEIAAGAQPDPAKIDHFLSAVAESTHHVYVEPEVEDTGGISEADCISTLAKALQEGLAGCPHRSSQ